MPGILNWISAAHPARFFLLDGFGALLSAGMLGIVLVRFQPFFGAPVPLLYVLALIACALAAYDFICYFRRVEPWAPFLRGIAWANVSYGVLTLILLAQHRDQLTAWGYAYFIGELVVVLALATAELRFAARFGNKG